MDRYTLEIAFDNLCQQEFGARRFAGRSKPVATDPPFAQLLYHANSTLMRPTLLSNDPDYIVVANSVHVDIVDHVGINAFASRFEKHHFIGIFKGICVRLFGTFLGLACHPRIFPLVGHVRSLQPFIRLRCKTSDGDDGYAEVSDNGRDWSIPRVDLLDDARLEMASSLYNYAVGFLLRHELGHIVRGHLQHLRGANSRPMLIESAAASGSA